MISPVPTLDGDDYASLLTELQERIRTARLKAAVAVNQELILLSWSIGRDILDRQTEADAGLSEGPLSISTGLAELEGAGKGPNDTRRFQSALRTLNQAAQGIDDNAAAEAAHMAALFLADLRAIRAGGAK